MEACWHQNRIEINFWSEKAKSPLVLEILIFFNRITFPGTKKTIPNRSKIIPKLKSRWEGLLTRIFSPFYMFFRAQDGPDIPKMAPQRRQDGSQDVAKTLPRPPRSSQDPSKTVQDAFKTAQDEPKTLQEVFKSCQDRQNDPQDASKTRF